MRLRSIAFAGALALGVGIAPMAIAQTQTYTYQTPFTVSEVYFPLTTFELPTFNSGLGTLNQVTIIFAATVTSGTVRVSCNDCYPSGAVGLAMGLSGSWGSFFHDLTFRYVPTDNSSFAGNLFGEMELPLITGASENWAIFPYDLSAFENTDPSSSLSFVMGGGYGGFSGSYGAGGTLISMTIEPYIQLTYDYTPSPVPEPETYAMMLAGLGLLSVVAKRRKKMAVTHQFSARKT